MLSPTQSLDAKLAMLPGGWAYPRDRDSRAAALLAPLASEHVAFELRAESMLPQAPSPIQAIDLLPDFERVLGPDPCAGPEPVLQSQRQAIAYTRWTALGGASLPAIAAIGAGLGYAITVTEYAPCCADDACADDPVYEPEWAYVWCVTYAGITISYASADEAVADDPVETSGNSPLECALNRIRPEHTVLLFKYAGALEVARWDIGRGWDSGGWAA